MVRPWYFEKYIATISCTWEWASSSFYSITLNIYQTNFNILTLEFFWKNIKTIWYLGLMLKPMCVNKVWLWSKGWHNEKEGGWEEEEKENEGFCSSRRRSFGTHWFDLIELPKFWCGGVRESPTESVNFCIIWRMNNDFYLYLQTFSNTLSNKLFISFSISYKYYFFIHYLFFFNNYTSFNIFFIQHLIIIIEKKDLKNEQ